jgi:hypothetical protein
MRRIPRRFPVGRLYEVEIARMGEATPIAKTTRTPVTLVDRYLGVGDAWALVHAADARWDGREGAWVTLDANGDA